jgi:hypothetical protein
MDEPSLMRGGGKVKKKKRDEGEILEKRKNGGFSKSGQGSRLL